MTPDNRETLEQLHAYAASRAEWHQSWMSPTDPAWDVDDLAECVEALARWGRRALALRAALASLEATPPAPADLVALVRDWQEAMRAYSKTADVAGLVDAQAALLTYPLPAAAPRVPERDTLKRPPRCGSYHPDGSRCAFRAGHEDPVHAYGARRWTDVPAAPPTPPQEGE